MKAWRNAAGHVAWDAFGKERYQLAWKRFKANLAQAEEMLKARKRIVGNDLVDIGMSKDEASTVLTFMRRRKGPTANEQSWLCQLYLTRVISVGGKLRFRS